MKGHATKTVRDREARVPYVQEKPAPSNTAAGFVLWERGSTGVDSNRLVCGGPNTPQTLAVMSRDRYRAGRAVTGFGQQKGIWTAVNSVR